jgi:hypothetical protein
MTTTTTTTTTIDGVKPLFVYVYWSESNDFEEKSLLPFHEFELKAKMVAFLYQDHGYCKTKINVLFSNGAEYGCRLDLSPSDTQCFKQHSLRMIDWVESDKDSHVQDYAPNAEFLKTVTWPE